ncbi:MAG: hypothetical protein GY943_35350, partial [Chloroflexi bacterium]|nr:hypothetical protein [Chloroflexota bacterium]
EAKETPEAQADKIPVEMVMETVLGGMKNEGEPVAEESDALEPDSAGYGLGMDLQMIQQERTLDIIESLPEPPESAREVTAAAETYNLLAAQEGITEMRQQDIEMRQEDAQSQIIEMEKVQEVTAVNQNALVGYQQDVNQKLAAQDKEKAASQQASNQAGQAQSEATSAQGIMGMVMAPLTKLLTKVVTEFTDMDTGGATGGASKANKSMKEPTKGADTGAAGGETGVAEAQERTMKTLRAQSDAAQTQKDLKVLDETMAAQTLGAEEGISELDEAQEETSEQQAEMQEGKDEALTQYEEGMDEATSWAEEHQTMREMMFEQLQDELQSKAEGERE